MLYQKFDGGIKVRDINIYNTLTKKVDKNKHVLSKNKAGNITIHLFELYENVKQAFKTLQKESKQVYKPERPISSTGSTVQ